MKTIDLDALVDEYYVVHGNECKKAGMKAGPTTAVPAANVKAALGEVLTQLKAKGFNILTLLNVIGPILTLLFQGTPIGQVVTLILALLQPTPTPVPSTPT